jgi:hypothetical protein
MVSLTQKGRDEEMCHEIIASGGMQSLLTLFKSSSDSFELMMVSALTAVYLLPLLLDDSVVQSSNYVHMGIIECLQFLIQTSIKNTTADIDISPSEIRTASAFAMTNLWFKVLVATLRSAEIVSASNHISRFGDGSESDQDFFSRRRSSVASWQSDEDVDWSILVDAFTSLSIMAAKSEASRPKNDLNVYYEFALIVESICAVEYARPLAMKEGVIALLLKWLRSGDIDLERPAASSLRNLALTQDNYTAGWVHSELVNEDTAIRFIVRRLESGDSGVRLAMAEVRLIPCLLNAFLCLWQTCQAAVSHLVNFAGFYLSFMYRSYQACQSPPTRGLVLLKRKVWSIWFSFWGALT